jgi:hypothetical protein
VEWVVREEWGQGEEMTQVLYACMKNNTIKIKKKNIESYINITKATYKTQQMTKSVLKD